MVCLPREVCVLEVFKITSLVCIESKVVMNFVVCFPGEVFVL